MACCTRDPSSRPRRTRASEASTRTRLWPLPGVVAVLVAADLPLATAGTDRTAEPLAREEVVFAGQPVALVVAESEAAAEDGAELVVVDYEPLDAVVDVEAAMEPGAALARMVEETDDEGGDLESIHTGDQAPIDPGQDDAQEQLSGNVLDRITRENGDVASAFAASDAVVEGTFRTPWIHQAYIEPQVCTAWLEPSGILVVSTSTQGSFVTRRELARAFDLPLERIRVIAEPLGGAFGGKFALVEPLAAGATLALRRPVRLMLTRTEDFQATNPASAQVTHLKIGARKDGTFTAIEGRMIVDRGSNAGWGVEGITSLLVAGPYRWQAHGHPRLWRADEPLHIRRVPCARRADGRLRARVAPRRARADSSSSTRSRCACGMPSSRATSASAAARSRRSARSRSSSGSASTRCGQSATRFQRTRESAWQPAIGPVETSPPRPSAGSTPTGR